VREANENAYYLDIMLRQGIFNKSLIYMDLFIVVKWIKECALKWGCCWTECNVICPQSYPQELWIVGKKHTKSGLGGFSSSRIKLLCTRKKMPAGAFSYVETRTCQNSN